MSVIILLILASLAVGLLFLGAFVWSVRSGQYEDTLTPSLRVLLDDATPPGAARVARPGEAAGVPAPSFLNETLKATTGRDARATTLATPASVTKIDKH